MHEPDTDPMNSAQPAPGAGGQGAPKGAIPRNRAFQLVLLILGAVVLFLGDQRYFHASRTPTSHEAAPVAEDTLELTDKQVETLKIAPVAALDFEVLKQSVGNIDFNQNLLVQVFAPYQGRIIAAYPNIADKVTKGDTLFTIDSPDLLQAESTLIAAAGVLTLQSRNLDRVRGLIKVGGVAQKDVDQATSDQQTAEGAMRAARDAVRIFGKTDDEIDRIVAQRKADPVLVIRAPISGVVTARSASPGLFVLPGAAPPPFVVADISTMWMLANVDESDSPAYSAGQEVRVHVSAFPDRVFVGKVTTVGASVDLATRRVLVRSEIADPDHLLRAGMFADFRIRIGNPARSLALPASAVVREGDGTTAAWTTIDRKTFKRRVVKVGQLQNGKYQLLEGLNENELAIVDGAIFLSNKLAGGAGD